MAVRMIKELHVLVGKKLDGICQRGCHTSLGLTVLS